MKKLRIAVISDIHVGEGARAKDLCPKDAPGWDKKSDEKYRDRFLEFIKKDTRKIDYLVLPGDVTHRSQPDEAKIASDFINEIQKAFKLKKERVVFVPGNHDVDWDVLRMKDSTGCRIAQRYDAIKFRDFIFHKIVNCGDGCVFEQPHFTIWNTPELLVVGYNSSHHDSPEISHHGYIDIKHLDEMKNAIGCLPLSRDQVRLFLVHHHIMQYDDPSPEWPDKSIMVNAEQLQLFLRESNFDMLVHGHKHLPRLTTHSIDGSPEVIILCSGSFSVTIDSKWAGTINNQFHIINIEERDEEENLIAGRVESWSYNYLRGWVESDCVHDGIPHIEPFGSYIRPTKLKELLRPLIAQGFLESDYIEWASLVKGNERLKHLRPKMIQTVLQELAPELGFRPHDNAIERLVLLKHK